jgi:metal-sulfur cluster biosynthetic enzyme
VTALHTDLAAGTGWDVTEEDIRRALDSVIDPELDEPITDLGFIRSLQVQVDVDGASVEVHLRLPTSFCSPNFAYLMASDSKDAIAALPAVKHVLVELDDHHDSHLINAGLAADAGYRGTFLHEAEDSLEELRWTFRRKAHTAAMERCLTDLLRANPELAETEMGTVRLGDLPTGRNKDALLRRRLVLGLPEAADSIVLVNHDGDPYPPEAVPMALRRARSTRISIDGNAHFCRGLLRTRYEGSGADQSARPEGAEAKDHHELLPLNVKEIHP